MVIDILKTIGIAFGSFFSNPLLYIGLIIILLVANNRISKERQSFHTRVYSRMADFVLPFWPSILAGTLISLVTIALGIIVNIPFLVLIAGLYVLLALTTKIRWITPVNVLALTIIILAVEPLVSGPSSLMDMYEVVSDVSIVSVFALLSLLLFVEGFLILRNGGKYTSPRLEKSKRGKWIGIHKQKRLWIVPVVLFIPNGLIPTFEFWPVLTVGEMTLQPVIVPFLFGLQYVIKSALPEFAIKLIGRRVLLLATGSILFVVIGYFFPVVAVIAAVAMMVTREWLIASLQSKEEQHSKYFTELKEGCIILGVLPGSPAEKMNLQVGETISKVNGRTIQNQDQFYKALQANSAFCKLEVLDYAGEVRFAQGALYVGEHHQLGVLLVKTEQTLQDSVI
ncbi:hypothetical protein AJ85_17300 [Alkalihalobacillus alcalophilus ATCC 27647 = CGMCC 1.3604]|uniref:PDZ domain-containing protein n=1 Tax=Alkalihalobacillus alcalophilus ATCC 27647 = CGMCC 1.3604 TaxID=1218173 RepID=A0A4S4JXM4_ALKAL|nr:PDZ domain-containing protein [Alkalihalobacillus alcalophilus]MED1564077.1 PDZ domain-containing protein [Alkalihalobacillus alcalophilus]THG89500.1 hypothetical protein AJ85_17300 [Alkalihalobacillus alcalophilus ATCC 27647 = CGMCC 1.3604]